MYTAALTSPNNIILLYLVPHSIDKIEAVKMSCLGQAGLRLSWTKPQSDLPIQYYAVTYAVGDVITGNITTITPNVTICNLPMGILHEVSIVAVSTLGYGRKDAWTVRSPTGNTTVYSINVFQVCTYIILLSIILYILNGHYVNTYIWALCKYVHMGTM